MKIFDLCNEKLKEDFLKKLRYFQLKIHEWVNSTYFYIIVDFLKLTPISPVTLATCCSARLREISRSSWSCSTVFWWCEESLITPLSTFYEYNCQKIENTFQSKRMIYSWAVLCPTIWGRVVARWRRWTWESRSLWRHTCLQPAAQSDFGGTGNLPQFRPHEYIVIFIRRFSCQCSFKQSEQRFIGIIDWWPSREGYFHCYPIQPVQKLVNFFGVKSKVDEAANRRQKAGEGSNISKYSE